MFVGAEITLNVSFDAACGKLTSLARGGSLRGVSDEAYGAWGQSMARIGPLGSAPGMSRLVDVRFRELAIRGRVAVMTVRWEAAGTGRALFPVLDADITLSPCGESSALLALTGAYRPPLGKTGAVLDRVVLHRIAAATIRGFVEDLGQAVVAAEAADSRVLNAEKPAP
jgi:hypothetical protein